MKAKLPVPNRDGSARIRAGDWPHAPIFAGKRVGIVLSGGNIDSRCSPRCSCAGWCATARWCGCAFR
jgi:hypothetical protein